MPYGDRTGPLGLGIPGRGLGPCGHGLRRGFGKGHAWRGMAAKPTPEEQRKALEAQLTELESEKQEVESRLKEMAGQKA